MGCRSNALNGEFNIGFFVPKKDQCDTCTTWKISNDEEKVKFKPIHDNHVKHKILCRKLKDEDSKESKKWRVETNV